MDRTAVARVVMQDADNPVVQGLMSLLLKYGDHEGLCMVYINGTCLCGWEELKKDLEGAVSD